MSTLLSWNDKKNKICTLIKKISDFYGGDDHEWLVRYCKEIINAYRDNIDEALACFESVAQTLYK